MYRTGIKILKSQIGIESSHREILPPTRQRVEIESLLTDFHQVEKIPFSKNMDGYISVIESAEEPFYKFSGKKALFKGPFLQLQKEASDLRFSLWGNQGFLYRYTLYLLERNHNIYNFHACALYHEEKNALYLVIGGPGSGKSVFLLSGILKGLKVFSTETVHFRMDKNEMVWFIGSLVDNVKFGTLIYDFPQFLPDVSVPPHFQAWQKKIAIDLSAHRASFEEIKNPSSIYLLFPRIEREREDFLCDPVRDLEKATKALFDNISNKLSETFILYDRIPVLGFDEKRMAIRRLHCAKQLVKHEAVKQIASILANPDNCWKGFFK